MLTWLPYFKENFKITAIDLSKQEAIDADSKAVQKLNFTANSDQAEDTMFLIIEETKETILDFSQATVSVF